MDRRYLLDQIEALLFKHIPTRITYHDKDGSYIVPNASNEDIELKFAVPHCIAYNVHDKTYSISLEDNNLGFYYYSNNLFEACIILSDEERAEMLLNFYRASKRYIMYMKDEIKVPSEICDTLESSLMEGCIPDGEK